MIFPLLGSTVFGDMRLLWFEENGVPSFTMVPADMEIPEHREHLAVTTALRMKLRQKHEPLPAYEMESSVQYHLAGDPYRHGLAAGYTMRLSESNTHLTKCALSDLPDGKLLTVSDDRGIVAFEQTYRHVEGEPFIRIRTKACNTGNGEIELNALPSFALGALSLFDKAEGIGNYQIFRWRSNWSNEGRMEITTPEEQGLEMSWMGYGVRTMRFGALGSMPVRDYFPQIGFMDKSAGVLWGAALDAKGAWELELFRQKDFFMISGGQPDREFGQWKKKLRPGESFTTPEACVTCVRGNIFDLQNRLSRYGESSAVKAEEDLPVMFNEFCTTWGKPYPERLQPIMERLKNRNIRYFVLDDGWAKSVKDPNWNGKHGEWNPSPEYDPEGFGAFMQKIRDLGFIPGVWFEFECVMPGCTLLAEHPDWVLHFDGKPIQSAGRCFPDFRKKEVVEYFTEKVIRFLKKYRIGYMKTDYNANTGVGCDGENLPAEELRDYTESVYAFYRKIREALPDLVLEVCSSGGHRLSAPWVRIASLLSFSDAHEGVEIPLIAANTANLVPVWKNQIWAVLHPDDEEKRFFYLLAAGFMGRLCLSGDMDSLTPQQDQWVDAAVKMYGKAVPLLKEGHNSVKRDTLSYTYPKGYQLFTRENASMKMVVFHTFEGAPEKLVLPRSKEWEACGIFLPSAIRYTEQKEETLLENLEDFTGGVILYRKK